MKDPFQTPGSGCAELARGFTITVRDGDGTMIASAEDLEGVGVGNDQCTLKTEFQVPDADMYSFTERWWANGSRQYKEDTTNVSRADLEANQWRVP